MVPFLYLCLRYYTSTLVNREERVKELESKLLERLYETFGAMRLVKSFAREPHELGRYGAAGEQTMNARIAITWQQSLFSVVVSSITILGTALVVIVGGTFVMRGRLTIGELIVVINYLAAVYGPLSAIAHTTGQLQGAFAGTRRVRAMFALMPETVEAPDAVDAADGHRRTSASRTSASLSRRHGRAARHRVRGEPGRDGRARRAHRRGQDDARQPDPALLRGRRRAACSSTTWTCAGTACARCARRSRSCCRSRCSSPERSPTTCGTDGSTRPPRRSRRPRRAAHAHEFIARLAKGYETEIAEAGGGLSGGERQRLSVARAILKNAPILILDEPTSSLDAISEEIVFAALRRLRASRTTVVIAHRLSTVRDADRILVLDGGRIAAQGRHEELLESSQLYRRMCARLSVGKSLDEPETVDELIEAAKRS